MTVSNPTLGVQIVETAQKGSAGKKKTTARGVARVRRRKNVFSRSSHSLPTVFYFLSPTYVYALRTIGTMLTRVPWWGWWDYLEFESLDDYCYVKLLSL